MYEQLTKNERLDKIVEMIDALRSEVVGIKNDLASTSTETVEETAVTVAETEIVEHEGLKLKRVDREAREGDYVRLVGNTSSLYTNGKIYGPVLRINGEICLENDEGVVPSLYRRRFNRTHETVEVFEVISAEKFEVEFTANQKRAELIEQAKKFVKLKSECLKDSPDVIGGYKRKEKENPKFCYFVMESEFIVNSKKRTVVCLLKISNDNDIKSRGIAKCAPNDVFNEHIGKAIALARALEIDVPSEFLEAVQPNKIVAGMIIKYKDGRIAEVINDSYRGHINVETQTYLSTAREYEYHARIIDDTNAQYEEKR